MSRITAYLGLDTAAFQAGLDRANSGLQRFKQIMRGADFGRSFTGLIGVGAMIQGFRATINAAQEARDRARELGRTVDEGTAAVARYGDQWDKIKRTVAEVAITGMSFLVRAGEGLGGFIGDRINRLQGMSQAEIDARNESEKDLPQRRAAQQAAQQAKEQKAAEAARTDDQRMRDVGRQMNDALERREELALREKPLAEQITALEQKRDHLLRSYNNERLKALDRARAFNEASKTEEEIARRRKEQEKQIAEEKEKQAEAQRKQNEAVEKAEKAFGNAGERAEKAADSLIEARKEMLRFTLADAAAGARGNPTDQFKAQQVLRDEETARRLADSGRKVVRFGNEEDQEVADRMARDGGPNLGRVVGRNFEAGAEFFQQRALAGRGEMEHLQEADRDPLSAASDELKAAGAALTAAATELKNVQVDVEVD